jgi:tetratricopeptide (TPR) repeat protein
MHIVIRFVRTLACTALLACTPALSGCAVPASLAQLIVDQRNHQGDMALENKNYPDAATAYRLALRVAPNDAHARAGLANVQLYLAADDYEVSKFDDALAALAVAAKYDPDSVRLAELRPEIQQARVNREIVLSNLPTYKETGLGLRRSYAQLPKDSNAIVSTLQRFDYSYDSAELARAIRQSNELSVEVAHLTARLVNYRQLVESGSPERSAQAPLAPAASLLPLP